MKEQQTTSLDELRQLWEQPAPGCANGQCPSRVVHIHAESITITNLILTGEVPAELRESLRRATA